MKKGIINKKQKINEDKKTIDDELEDEELVTDIKKDRVI